MSLSAQLVSGGRGSISVGPFTLIAFKSLIQSRSENGVVQAVRIGRNTFIGGGDEVLPGVRIGSGVVVGAGTVVDRDVPDGCLVAGCPMRVLETDIEVGQFGRFHYADENQQRYWKP